MQNKNNNAEEIGDAYAKERFKGAYVAFPVAMANGDILTANVPIEEMRKIVSSAFRSGDGNGYSRGKAEAEKRICAGLRERIEAWKTCPEHNSEPLDELTYAFVEQIIFGGGGHE